MRNIMSDGIGMIKPQSTLQNALEENREMNNSDANGFDIISNPVASELILPTVRTPRQAVSRKLIGRWLHLSWRAIDYFRVGKRHCRVQSCLGTKTKETGFFPFSTAVTPLLGKNPVSGHPRII
jgi:hypothetical protein